MGMLESLESVLKELMSTVRGPGFSLWGPELEQGRSRSGQLVRSHQDPRDRFRAGLQESVPPLGQDWNSFQVGGASLFLFITK